MEFHRRRKIDAGIDMTPMIDTLLQLFLVFLLTASFLAVAVPLNLPKASTDPSPPAEAVVVALDVSKRTFVNDKPIERNELRGSLLALMQKNKDPVVILRADRSLPYEHVLEVLAAITQAGVTQVHLAHDTDGGR